MAAVPGRYRLRLQVSALLCSDQVTIHAGASAPFAHRAWVTAGSICYHHFSWGSQTIAPGST